jgi:hypothetical protein
MHVLPQQAVGSAIKLKASEQSKHWVAKVDVIGKRVLHCGRRKYMMMA